MGDALECPGCGVRYRFERNVPILLAEDREVRVVPDTHVSNEMPDEVLSWLENLDGYSLNLGAGATPRRISRCLEVEYAVFRNTFAVADAHDLPFHDDVFEAVVSLNTFEHLSDPGLAARELFRVLRPGGTLQLQTAFLQPLHEAPAHFYNATEFGVRNWFKDFTIERCYVSRNFSPAFTLAWLANEILWNVGIDEGSEVRDMLSQTTLAQWQRFWADPSSRSGFLAVVMDRLSQEAQSRFSSGFELLATKPDPSS